MRRRAGFSAHIMRQPAYNKGMMMPDPSTHNPSPEYARELVARIGQSQAWIAAHSGISKRRLQYILAGTRTINDYARDVSLTYPEQYTLEALAAAGQVFAARN